MTLVVMICRICGEEKECKEFYRVKHFQRFHNKDVKWCRVCQKLYLEMKRQEAADKLKDLMKGTFCVSFS